MIKQLTRTLFIVLIFFLLDLMKPFGYYLSVEFLFLGLIIIACNESLLVSLIASFLSAWFRDFFIFAGSPIAIFEFPLLCLFIQYLRSHRLLLTKQKNIFITKSLIISLSLIIHVLANSLYLRLFIAFFSFQFFIQSICIYYLIDYLLGLELYSNSRVTVF